MSNPGSARFVAHYRSMTTSEVRQFRLPLSTSGYRRESVERPNAQHKQVREAANAANLYVPQIPCRLHVKSAGGAVRRIRQESLAAFLGPKGRPHHLWPAGTTSHLQSGGMGGFGFEFGG